MKVYLGLDSKAEARRAAIVLYEEADGDGLILDGQSRYLELRGMVTITA